MPKSDGIAQSLYEAYANHTDWKSAVTGSPLPPWEKLQDEVQAAWEAVAEVVRDMKQDSYMEGYMEG